MKEEINKRFKEKFFQDKTGEKCDGWLAMRTDILKEGDYKIALPQDVLFFLHQEIDRALKEQEENWRANGKLSI